MCIFRFSQVKKELKARMDDQKQADTRTLADMDARVTSMQRKLHTVEEDLDRKLSQVWEQKSHTVDHG